MFFVQCQRKKGGQNEKITNKPETYRCGTYLNKSLKNKERKMTEERDAKGRGREEWTPEAGGGG